MVINNTFMVRKARVTTMKTSPLTLALFIPIILVSAGSRPKKYKSEPPNEKTRQVLGRYVQGVP